MQFQKRVPINRDRYYKPRFLTPGVGYTIGHNPKRIAIHTTNNPRGNTTFESECTYLAEQSRDSSSHYAVPQEPVTIDDKKYDAVRMLIPGRHTAWTNGTVISPKYWNRYCVTIECHYSPADSIPAWTDWQIDALTRLCLEICWAYGITPSDETIVTHRHIAKPYGDYPGLDYRWNRDPGGWRKIDPSGLSDREFRIWRQTLIDVWPEYQRFIRG